MDGRVLCDALYRVKVHRLQPSKLTQVDSWIDFCAHEIELPATIWCYPVIGYMPYNDAAVSKAKEDLKTALGALEQALLERTYLVRNSCARWLLCDPPRLPRIQQCACWTNLKKTTTVEPESISLAPLPRPPISCCALCLISP